MKNILILIIINYKPIIFRRIIINLPELIYYLIYDLKHTKKIFRMVVGFFVGRQGSGKTISLVRTLDELQKTISRCKNIYKFCLYKTRWKVGRYI